MTTMHEPGKALVEKALKLLRTSRRGYILLMGVLLIGAITMSATISLLLLSWANEQNGLTFEQAEQAIQLARSCADQGLLQMQAMPNYYGSGSLRFGGGTCRVLAAEGAGAFHRSLCSIGIVGAVTKRIRVDIDSMYPQVNVSGYEEVENFAGCGGYAAWQEAHTGTGSSSSSASSGGSSSSIAATTNTLLAFNISNSGSIGYMGSFNAGTVLSGIAVSGTSAIIARSMAGQELFLIDNTDPALMSGGQILAGPAIGLAAARGNGQVLLGSQKTTMGNGKFRLWRMEDGGTVSSPGPWTYTTSGSSLRVAADPTGCYAFAATNWAAKSLQVVKIKNEVMTEAAAYAVNAGTVGNAVSLLNDPSKDRVYLVTKKGLAVLGPSSSSPSCP